MNKDLMLKKISNRLHRVLDIQSKHIVVNSYNFGSVYTFDITHPTINKLTINFSLHNHDSITVVMAILDALINVPLDPEHDLLYEDIKQLKKFVSYFTTQEGVQELVKRVHCNADCLC